MSNKRTRYIIAILLCTNSIAFASPMKSDSVLITQSDGSSIWLIERGDEYYSWVETTDGTILDSKKVLINNN